MCLPPKENVTLKSSLANPSIKSLPGSDRCKAVRFDLTGECFYLKQCLKKLETEVARLKSENDHMHQVIELNYFLRFKKTWHKHRVPQVTCFFAS